ncbi:MAG: hypothetical protein HKN00_09470 [Flavobacteriaceae bacterium]|nr:hypothetical protein [Flavobacteriaceae bacterium]
MSNQIRYRILVDIPITLIRVEGILSIEMPKRFLDQICADPDFNPEVNMIYDFTSGEIPFNRSEIEDLSKFFVSHPEYSGNRREVYVVNSPQELAKLSIFSMQTRELPVKFNVVTSIREALGFTGIDPMYFSVINKVFTELQSS